MIKKKYFKTKAEAEVTFEFQRDDVQSAALLSEFNDWQPIDMKFNRKDKTFRTKVRLPVNTEFEFRYLLNDAEWENDYLADSYVPNQFGSQNSVVSIVA